MYVLSYYFMKEIRNGFYVFQYCDSNTLYADGLSKSLKTRLFSQFATVLKWVRFVDQGSIFIILK